MDLKELGSLLQQQRLHKGINISDVAAETKISPHYLDAIEQGNAGRLPHTAFAKGFIRNYARFLGLDTPAVQDAVKAIFSTANASFPEGIVRSGRKHTDTTFLRSEDARDSPADAALTPRTRTVINTRRLLIYSGALLLAIVIGIAAVRAVGTFLEPAPEEQGTLSDSPQPSASPKIERDPDAAAPPAQELPSQPPEAVAAPDEKTPGELAEQDVRADLKPALDVLDSTEVVTEVVDDAELRKTDEATAVTVPVEAAALVKQRTLEIQAQAACWMRIWPDDQSFRDYLLKPGDYLTLPFEETIQIRFGNAGGVRLYLDGDFYPMNAASGEVMTVRIP